MRRIVLVLLGLAALVAAYPTEKDLSVINARIDYNHNLILTVRNNGAAGTTARVSFWKFPKSGPHATGGLHRTKLVEVPADTTMDVKFHGKVYLGEFCNLFTASIECSLGSLAHETNLADNTLVFRICKRSDGSKGAAEMIMCDGLEDLLDIPHEYGRECAKKAVKECRVECCRQEAHVVANPQCCLQAMNSTESSTYLDEFETVAYDNSDGSATWTGMPWQENSITTPSPPNLDDNNPATGRIRIEGGELVLSCSDGMTGSCDLGCLVEEPMYISRAVDIPSCIAPTSTIRIGARYTALSEGAVLNVYRMNYTLIKSIGLPSTAGLPSSIDMEVEIDFDYENVFVEIVVPVISCHSNIPTDVRIGILQVKHTCAAVNIECPAAVVSPKQRDSQREAQSVSTDFSRVDRTLVERAVGLSPTLPNAMMVRYFTL